MLLFFSYSHTDHELRDQLEKHLAALQRENLIEGWHDRRIMPGEAINSAIQSRLEEADIILLLISADFIASYFCVEVEMRQALQRHEAGQAVVVPVILRECDWRSLPFGTLKALPRDAKPVMLWPDRDQAFADVAREIRRLVEDRRGAPPGRVLKPRSACELEASSQEGPRSSNLRIAKVFTDRDRHDFLIGGYEYIGLYFENSLTELQRRESGITYSFRRVDANQFTTVVFRDGQTRATCLIRLNAGHHQFGAPAITFAHGATGEGFSEAFHVESDEQHLFFRSLGVATRASPLAKLTYEGVAEALWALFLEPLQRAA